MKPDHIAFDLGENVFGQQVRLHHGVSSGKSSWTISRLPAGQRDDASEVGGLTDDQLLAMARAVATAKTIR